MLFGDTDATPTPLECHVLFELPLTFAVERRRRSGRVCRRVVRARPTARLTPLRLVVALKTTTIVNSSKKLGCFVNNYQSFYFM